MYLETFNLKESGEQAYIARLVDYPQFSMQIARWIYDEWGRGRPNTDYRQVLIRYQTYLNRDRLPIALLALQEDPNHGLMPIGTASLRQQDLSIRRNLNPWLAAVYVIPSRRNQSVASRLILSAESEARRLGVDQLYLWTPDQENLYAKLGWKAHERAHYRGQDIVIMKKDLHKKAHHPEII